MGDKIATTVAELLHRIIFEYADWYSKQVVARTITTTTNIISDPSPHKPILCKPVLLTLKPSYTKISRNYLHKLKSLYFFSQAQTNLLNTELDNQLGGVVSHYYSAVTQTEATSIPDYYWVLYNRRLVNYL